MNEDLTATRGTRHHNKSEDGRAYQIEKYISQGVSWIIDHYRKVDGHPAGRPISVVDFGCDYGFMLYDFKNSGVKNLVGVDMFYNANPFDLPLYREDMMDPTLPKRVSERLGGVVDLLVMNHSLEHVANPHAVMSNVARLHPHRVFIAVPDANSEWAQWDSHMTCWTMPFLKHFMSLHEFKCLDSTTKCFRNNLVENWAMFKPDIRR